MGRGKLIRHSGRLIARPRAQAGERAEVDVARLIEEERDRWPGESRGSLKEERG